MTVQATIKTGLVLTGIVLFGIGIRTGNEPLRWVGVACVAAAWLMRFVRR